jgi:hypothetical protein
VDPVAVGHAAGFSDGTGRSIRFGSMPQPKAGNDCNYFHEGEPALLVQSLGLYNHPPIGG